MNQNKTIVQRTQYHAFGLPHNDYQNTKPESSSNRFKYSGKEFDEMHGLNWYDFHACHYDPILGRFTSMDPLAEKYYSINPYVYCANNPLKFTDPTGMWILVNDGSNTYKYESGKLYKEDMKNGKLTYSEYTAKKDVLLKVL